MAKNVRRIFVLASLMCALFSAPAAAQSGGCAGGPYAGATTLDSDGDGVNDADEASAGTDPCDPASTPVLVCGSYVNGYDASTFDADNDSHSDADEIAAGTDPCDSSSVIAAAATATTAAPATTSANTSTSQQAPTLALTGPSTVSVLAVVGVAMLLLGGASLAVGRRVEA